MALPEAVEVQPIITPPASPTNIPASIRPAAGLTDTYLGGYAGGDLLLYTDMMHFVWFEPLNLPDRFRSHYTTTLGEVMVGTPQADVGASETVPRGEGYDLGDRTDYASMARPLAPFARLTAISDQGGTPAFEQTVAFESALSHLARLFPASTYVTAQDAVGEDTMTAQEVIQYLFDAWEAQFPGRFRARPVPPIRLFVPDDDGAYTRTLVTDRIHLRQPPDRRRSIQTLLQDLRATFPGYGVDADHEGFIVLLPPPWALEADTEPVAEPSYRLGPASWVQSPDDIQAVGRADVSSSPWEIDPAYDGTHLEVRLQFRTAVSIDEDGLSTVMDLTGNIVTRTVTLAPNVGSVVEYSFQVGELDTIFTIRYLVTWSRPGSMGGTVLVNPTQAVISFPVPEAGVTLYFAHSALLDARSVGELGAPVVNVDGDEVHAILPAAAYDASRVINAQRATFAQREFVEGDDLTPVLAVRAGPTAFDPPAATVMEHNTFIPFDDGEEPPEPLITGSVIDVAYSYWMRGSASLSGPTGEVGFEGPISGTVQVMVGGASVVNIALGYPWVGLPGQSYWVARIRFRYQQQPDGRFGIVVDFPAYRDRIDNPFQTRPFLGHVVAFQVSGSVFRETGVEIDVEFSADSVAPEDPVDPEVVASTQRFGRREGPVIPINFFEVTEQDMLDIVRSIVLYNCQPRARWHGVKLTAAGELSPRSLGRYLLLPWGSTAVFEAFRASDASAVEGSSVEREFDAVQVYELITGGSGVPGADTDDEAVEFAHGWDGVSWDLPTGHIPDAPT